MAELADLMWLMPDGPSRARLETWYWKLAAEEHGPRNARWYEEEYRWLRSRAREEER